MTILVPKVKKPFTGAKQIIGLWDYQNTQVPTLCTINNAVSSLYIALNARGIHRPLFLYAVGNEKLLYNHKAKRDMEFFVDNYLPIGPYKQAANARIRYMIDYWSRTHEEGDFLALVASGGGYEEELTMLEDKGQHLLLFGHDKFTSPKLTKHAYIFWKWRKLLQANETNENYKMDIMGTMKKDRKED